MVDNLGSLYGTTYLGGVYDQGTVYKLTPDTNGRWKEKVLHNFSDAGGEGALPEGNLVVRFLNNIAILLIVV